MEDEDGNSYDPFGGMQLIFTADGADEDSIDWNLAIAAGGATLGSVSLTGGNGGETLAAVDVASLTALRTQQHHLSPHSQYHCRL